MDALLAEVIVMECTCGIKTLPRIHSRVKAMANIIILQCISYLNSLCTGLVSEYVRTYFRPYLQYDIRYSVMINALCVL